jgi:hypothetical protein
MNVIIRAPTSVYRLFFALLFCLITMNLFYFLYFFSRPCITEGSKYGIPAE